jgi:hypothetical protein
MTLYDRLVCCSYHGGTLIKAMHPGQMLQNIQIIPNMENAGILSCTNVRSSGRLLQIIIQTISYYRYFIKIKLEFKFLEVINEVLS